MKNIIKLINKESVSDIINGFNNIIFDEKIWLGEEMWKIAEVTYSYSNIKPKTKEKLTINGKEININTTLFCSIGGLNLETFNSLSDEEKVIEINKASDILKAKIQEKEILIKKALNEVKSFKNQKTKSKNSINNFLNSFKNKINFALLKTEGEKISFEDFLEAKDLKEQYLIEIFEDSLNEKLDFFEYCLNGLPYELEKAGIEVNLTQEQEKEIDKKQKKLDEKLFGGEIQNNESEVIKCYEFLIEEYEENKSKLTKKEDEKYNFFLSKIKVLLPKNYKYVKKEKLENYLDKYEKLKIKNNEYILGFNLLLESLEKLKHNAERSENVKSVSDGPNGIQFPTTEDFIEITLKRFLTLNIHEIDAHSIEDHNSSQIIGNLRGAGSTIKAEGLAVLMELLLQHGKQLFKIDEKSGKQIIDIDKIPTTKSHTNTLMGELLNNEELFDFLNLTHKLKAGNISPKNRYDRIKRSNKNGLQYKDTSYSRGLFQVIEEINKFILSSGKEGTSIESLFLGKVSVKDTKKLEQIKKSEEKLGKKFDIVMPVFSSDTILFNLEQFEKGKKINKDDFLLYLEDKYPIFNFTKQQIDELSYKTKRNIAGVIDMTKTIALKENIKNNIKDDKGQVVKFNQKKISSEQRNKNRKHRKKIENQKRREAA